ncbi:ATP-binding cassette domain-containing protein [Paracoccaceae bacterium]|nr:ATP-binding cassette domain-containing protein [Paracoccaceae bacterium]
MLTGPLYKLQVYDSVLSSRSLAIVLVFAAWIALLCMITGIRDCCRTRRMARSGKGFPQALEKPFLDAAMGASLSPDDKKGSTGLRNRDAIQRWVSSPALIALFDPPWTSPFLAGIRMLHPLLGSFALVAVAILIALALVNQWSSRMVLAEAHRGLYHVNGLSDKIRTETDMSQTMGMHQATYTRWQAQQRGAALTQLVAANLAGTFGAVIKTTHMLLQSAILGPSAYLVLKTAVSPGAMIASSVLMGRALARAPTPVRAPAGGIPRLDGASLNHYDPSLPGVYIGLLLKNTHFFDGSLTENIVRMLSSPDPQSVANAAQKACAHEMVLHLPEGYDTILGGGGMQLSGGQMRRIGLAQALYSDPVNLILDKPNSNLDSAGNATLNTTIRQIKAIQKTGLIIGKWPAAIAECGVLPVLDDGRQTVFGPRDKIRASMVQNHGNIASAIRTNSAGLR